MIKRKDIKLENKGTFTIASIKVYYAEDRFTDKTRITKSDWKNYLVLGIRRQIFRELDELFYGLLPSTTMPHGKIQKVVEKYEKLTLKT